MRWYGRVNPVTAIDSMHKNMDRKQDAGHFFRRLDAAPFTGFAESESGVPFAPG